MTSEQFEALTPAERRVAVAKDVIKQINAGKYIADKAWYIFLPDICRGTTWDIKENFDKIKDCTVCQIGAIILSTTKFRNKLKFSDVGRNPDDLNVSKIKSILAGVFKPKQLFLIECAYEGGYNANSFRYGNLMVAEDKQMILTEKEEMAIYKICDQYPIHEDRMIYIMKNIIKNKGTFKLV